METGFYKMAQFGSVKLLKRNKIGEMLWKNKE
jgi:hypothetical protein